MTHRNYSREQWRLIRREFRLVLRTGNGSGLLVGKWDLIKLLFDTPRRIDWLRVPLEERLWIYKSATLLTGTRPTIICIRRPVP